MKAVIVGYGQMGHEIERVLRDRGHAIAAIVDPAASGATAPSLDEAIRILAEGDSPGEPVVAIDFALPDSVQANTKAYARAGWAAVLGTTGWEDRREEVLAPVRAAGTSLVYGSNFSVGANMFVRVARYAARLASRTGEYDAALVELHHRLKKDSPSGTAITVAQVMQEELKEKRLIQVETVHRRIEREELHVISGRVGSVPGTHTVMLDSTADTVELTHRARSRQGFAVGAVQAAEWIVGRRGVYSVEAFFDDLFE
ncbi:MAG: 4-hydroxy-tetrahydrodipicolinate reductase [Spirochaetaceae bacterium]|nr:MAG: 4-hydroxy-tetrahydrodipicolinate reductase [Spirochaetaceae bacterium]